MSASPESSSSSTPSDRVYQVRREHCTDDSITVHPGANVNVNRFALPKDARELILATIAAASVLTSLWLWSKLHDAEKDIQTQVWLRDDALTKFEQGPFADVKAHVLALEITCKKGN